MNDAIFLQFHRTKTYLFKNTIYVDDLCCTLKFANIMVYKIELDRSTKK